MTHILVRNICIFSLIFWMAVPGVQAQKKQQHWYEYLLEQNPDTLSQYYSQLAFDYAAFNSDSARLLLDKSMQHAHLRTDTAGIFNSTGWMMFHRGEYDSAQYFLTKAAAIFRAEKNIIDEVRSTTNLAVVFSRQNLYGEAIRQLLKADSLLTYDYDVHCDLFIKRELGILYRQTGDMQKASRYVREVLAGFSRIGEYQMTISSAISLGIFYRATGDFDSSLAIMFHYLDSMVKKDDVYNIAIMNENIGETYFDAKDYASSKKHFKISYDIVVALGNVPDIAYEALGMGKSLLREGSLDAAEKYLVESYTISDSMHMVNYAYEAAEELATLYEARKDWLNAFHYQKISDALGDTLATYEQRQKFSALQGELQLQKKDQEISLLNANNEIEKSKSKRATLMMYLIIAAVLILLMVTYIVFTRYRTRQISQIQEVRNKIAGDLHDDIGSTLSSINMYSQIIRQQIRETQPDAYPLLEKISDNAQETIQNMSDIVWAIKPDNDAFEYVENRMLNFAVELCTPNGIALKFPKNELLAKLKLSMETRRDLYLVFKEAINNAVKYAEATQIEIKLRKKGQWLKMTIADNGKGFDVEARMHKSNGLTGMQKRTAAHGGELEISSKPGEGTVITLRIPIT